MSQWCRGILKHDGLLLNSYTLSLLMFMITYMERQTRARSQTHSKVVPSITSLHLSCGHVAPSVFPQADRFCRLGGHGTTITSKHP